MSLKTVKEILSKAMTNKSFRVKLLDKKTADKALSPYNGSLNEDEIFCLKELTPEKLEEISSTSKVGNASDIRI